MRVCKSVSWWRSLQSGRRNKRYIDGDQLKILTTIKPCIKTFMEEKIMDNLVNTFTITLGRSRGYGNQTEINKKPTKPNNLIYRMNHSKIFSLNNRVSNHKQFSLGVFVFLLLHFSLWSMGTSSTKTSYLYWVLTRCWYFSWYFAYVSSTWKTYQKIFFLIFVVPQACLIYIQAVSQME